MFFAIKQRHRTLMAIVTFVIFAGSGCHVVSGLDEFTVSSTESTGAGGSGGTSGSGGNSSVSSSTSSTSTSSSSSSSSASSASSSGTSSSSSSASSAASSSSSSSASSSSNGGIPQIVSFGENGNDTHTGVTTDTTLDQSSVMANFGGNDVVQVDPSPLRVGLVRFDLSALPITTQVMAAEFRIYVGGNNAPNGTTVDLFEVLEGWTEGTNNGQPGVANWQQRTAANAWTTAGANPPSRATMTLGTFSPTKVNTMYMVPLNAQGIAVVQQWIANPNSNNGFAVPPTTGGWSFQSSEAAGSRPSLVLTILP